MKNSQVKEYIANKISGKKDEIEEFFASKYQVTKPVFYSSVDVRHSGYKIVPVDTNLFPAGFNLLTKNQAKAASLQVSNYFKKNQPETKNIILIIEAHDRNKFYLQNVKSLKNIIEEAGFNIVPARVDIDEKIALETADGGIIEVFPLNKNGNDLFADGVKADAIIVNNDFSTGSPDILKSLNAPIFPPVGMGWYQRRKSSHFNSYEILAREFCRKFDIDIFTTTAMFRKCGKINFKSREGMECVAENINEILLRLKAKYREYKIEYDPYVFVKANSGTYGMGIKVIKSASEILEINKKERHSMNSIKEGQLNNEVIIQEGVPTIDEFEGNPAEPMIYMVNGNVISCNYRLNKNQDEFGNLNSKGMDFIQFECSEEGGAENQCPVQSTIARLATLAASQECYENNWQI